MTGTQPGRRAPRLGADETIAPHVTRHGRFRKVDPTRDRELPGLARILGFVGWAALLGESMRRARSSR